MANMASVLGLIFANMHDMTITDLTKMRTTGSVPFGARYRLIDFPLSNMVNCGISSVGVITKANYQSLLDHLGSGSEWDLSRKQGGLRLLPPYGHANDGSPVGNGLYRGRLEAMIGAMHFIKESPDEYVLMSDCDIICNIDYKAVLDYHISKNADITVVYGRDNFSEGRLKTKTVLSINQDDLVYDVLVRPEDGGEVNASMNMFIMKKDFLLDIISQSASRNLYSFEVDILQHRCKEYKIYGYKYEHYYSQIDSIITYFNANMELMDLANRKALFNGNNPIYTKVRDEAPAKYGLEACVTNSLVADGCIIEGYVESCVLFRGVRVGKGAVLKNCILMQDTVVGDKCEMNYVISDKNVKVGSYRSLFGTQDYPVFVGKSASV